MNLDSKIIKLKSYIFFIVFSLFVAYFIFNDDGTNYNFHILFINFLIAEISLIMLFLNCKYPYSMNVIFHLFFLFFFGIAPALQFKHAVTLYYNVHSLTLNEYFYGNILSLIILLFYNFIYNFRHKILSIKIQIYKENLKNKKVRTSVLVFISIIAVLIFSYSKNFNLYAIFFRGGILEIDQNLNIDNSALSLIINIFIRPIPLISLILYKKYQTEKSVSIEIFLILLTLFIAFPTGMPRFQAAALYIPVLIFYFKIFSKPVNFVLFFCLGFLIIFPFLDQFRKPDNFKNDISLNYEMFLQAHFDTYQNTINVISKDNVTYGNQLLGVVLFFIPREEWPSKPMGSGAYLAEQNGYDWSNVSLSFFGEGFINFGFFGIFIFTLFLAVITSYLDFMYWNRLSKSNIRDLAYIFLLGMLFFILRGDLLSSFSYTVGLLLSIVFIYKTTVTINK